MATNGLIDAQFDRAVEIVQGLPKTGPIQTDYEEKLTMYRYGFYKSLSSETLTSIHGVSSNRVLIFQCAHFSMPDKRLNI
jgi:hypothetical protein